MEGVGGKNNPLDLYRSEGNFPALPGQEVRRDAPLVGRISQPPVEGVDGFLRELQSLPRTKQRQASIKRLCQCFERAVGKNRNTMLELLQQFVGTLRKPQSIPLQQLFSLFGEADWRYLLMGDQLYLQRKAREAILSREELIPKECLTFDQVHFCLRLGILPMRGRERCDTYSMRALISEEWCPFYEKDVRIVQLIGNYFRPERGCVQALRFFIGEGWHVHHSLRSIPGVEKSLPAGSLLERLRRALDVIRSPLWPPRESRSGSKMWDLIRLGRGDQKAEKEWKHLSEAYLQGSVRWLKTLEEGDRSAIDTAYCALPEKLPGPFVRIDALRCLWNRGPRFVDWWARRCLRRLESDDLPNELAALLLEIEPEATPNIDPIINRLTAEELLALLAVIDRRAADQLQGWTDRVKERLATRAADASLAHLPVKVTRSVSLPALERLLKVGCKPLDKDAEGCIRLDASLIRWTAEVSLRLRSEMFYGFSAQPIALIGKYLPQPEWAIDLCHVMAKCGFSKMQKICMVIGHDFREEQPIAEEVRACVQTSKSLLRWGRPLHSLEMFRLLRYMHSILQKAGAGGELGSLYFDVAHRSSALSRELHRAMGPFSSSPQRVDEMLEMGANPHLACRMGTLSETTLIHLKYLESPDGQEGIASSLCKVYRQWPPDPVMRSIVQELSLAGSPLVGPFMELEAFQFKEGEEGVEKSIAKRIKILDLYLTGRRNRWSLPAPPQELIQGCRSLLERSGSLADRLARYYAPHLRRALEGVLKFGSGQERVEELISWGASGSAHTPTGLRIDTHYLFTVIGKIRGEEVGSCMLMRLLSPLYEKTLPDPKAEAYVVLLYQQGCGWLQPLLVRWGWSETKMAGLRRLDSGSAEGLMAQLDSSYLRLEAAKREYNMRPVGLPMDLIVECYQIKRRVKRFLAGNKDTQLEESLHRFAALYDGVVDHHPIARQIRAVSRLLRRPQRLVSSEGRQRILRFEQVWGANPSRVEKVGQLHLPAFRKELGDVRLRIAEAHREAEAVGLTSRRTIKAFHGTRSRALYVMLLHDKRLHPAAKLLKAGVAPLTGELLHDPETVISCLKPLSTWSSRGVGWHAGGKGATHGLLAEHYAKAPVVAEREVVFDRKATWQGVLGMRERLRDRECRSQLVIALQRLKMTDLRFQTKIGPIRRAAKGLRAEGLLKVIDSPPIVRIDLTHELMATELPALLATRTVWPDTTLDTHPAWSRSLELGRDLDLVFTDSEEHRQTLLRHFGELGVRVSLFPAAHLMELLHMASGTLLEEISKLPEAERVGPLLQNFVLPSYAAPFPQRPTRQELDGRRTAVPHYLVDGKDPIDYATYISGVKEGRIAPRGDHGPIHGARVALWSQMLAAYYWKHGGHSLEVPAHELAVAAGCHDIARQSDGHDWWDAESALWLDDLLRRMELPKERREVLTHALREKDPKGEHYTTNVHCAVHDADSLDIVRCIDLPEFDPAHLTHPALRKDKELLDQVSIFIGITEDEGLKKLLCATTTDLYGDLIRIIRLVRRRIPRIAKLLTKQLNAYPGEPNGEITSLVRGGG